MLIYTAKSDRNRQRGVERGAWSARYMPITTIVKEIKCKKKIKKRR